MSSILFFFLVSMGREPSQPELLLSAAIQTHINDGARVCHICPHALHHISLFFCKPYWRVAGKSGSFRCLLKNKCTLHRTPANCWRACLSSSLFFFFSELTSLFSTLVCSYLKTSSRQWVIAAVIIKAKTAKGRGPISPIVSSSSSSQEGPPSHFMSLLKVSSC